MPSLPRPRLSSGSRFAGLLLFVLPLPLLFKAIGGLWGGDLGQLVANASAYAMFVLGALAARKGLVREARHLSRPLAEVPPPPLKLFATLIIGAATAVAAFSAAGHDIIISGLFGIGASAGMILYYGLDRRKTVARGERDVSADELSAALQAAYARLDGIDEARRDIRSREFQERLSGIVALSHAVLRQIEEDPRMLRRARKFLNVYLEGVLGVTQRYSRAQQQGASPELEGSYRALLMDMEALCKEQHKKLRQNESVDLDIQIEVLATRIKQEGVI